MKKVCTLLFLLAFAFGICDVSSQYLNEIYVDAVVSTGSEIFGGSSTEDVVGNNYQVFMFPSGSSFTIGEISLTNQGGFDTALVKFDPIGNVDWVRTLQSPGNDEFFQVTTDTAGNVYAVGFSDTAQLGLVIDSSWDGILVKYDSNGNLQFVTNHFSAAYTSGEQDVLSAITYSNNFLYIVHQSTNTGHCRIIQTDLSGAVQWVYTLPWVNVQSYNIAQLVVDPLRNQIYVSGYVYAGEWSNSVSNGKTVTGFTTQSWDGFLFALGTNGFAQWVVPQQTSSNDYSYTVALDSAGYVYVGSCISGSVFGQPYTPTYYNWCNPLVSKYDWLGNRQWTRIYNQYGNCGTHSVVLDNAGAFYARVTDGSNQAIIKSDTNGNVVWTQSISGTTGLARDGGWNLPTGFGRGSANAYLDSTGALTMSGVYQGQFFGWASNPFVPYVSKWQLNISCSGCGQFDSLLAELQTLLNVVVS